MSATSLPDARWGNYILESGAALDSFYKGHFGKAKTVCFILGRGFDPRMCLGLERLVAAHGPSNTDVVVIEFDEGSSSPSNAYQKFVDENMSTLPKLIPKAAISTRSVKMFAADNRRISSRSAAGLFKDIGELKKYTDIVVDISALPRSIYFPLISKLLFLIDEAKAAVTLHVLVAENPDLDMHIRDEGPDDVADYVHPFRGGLDQEAAGTQPKVWIPILGEGQAEQLTRIHDLVKPDEISPLLPSPSLDPRRGDNLVYEYREFLFDELRIEPRNIIYASERNPFEAYKQIRKTIGHYRRALSPLGGCRSILSAVSSKLLSMGAVLVAYELKQAKIDVGIAHVESQGYSAEESVLKRKDGQAVLFGMVLSGEYYD